VNFGGDADGVSGAAHCRRTGFPVDSRRRKPRRPRRAGRRTATELRSGWVLVLAGGTSSHDQRSDPFFVHYASNARFACSTVSGDAAWDVISSGGAAGGCFVDRVSDRHGVR